MPPSTDNKPHPEPYQELAEGEREFEKFQQGLKRLVAYYRERLTRAEAALQALQGKSSSVPPRLNKTIKDLLARLKTPQGRDEIKAELIRAGIISATAADSSRVDRSLRQCVNSRTLIEREGKFTVPSS